MEYTQWEGWRWNFPHNTLCLNPCCNGIYSMRAIQGEIETLEKVLILVVMEYTQWAGSTNSYVGIELVLILVVMEYTQWVYEKNYNRELFAS